MRQAARVARNRQLREAPDGSSMASPELSRDGKKLRWTGDRTISR
jgi:hypothetical protein